MKIDAEVELSGSKEEDYGESFVKVPVDADYVEGNAESVKEWVRNELEEKYGVPVALVNCMELDADDVREILGMILEEFPVAEIAVTLPAWTTALDPTHPIRASVLASVAECAAKVGKMGDVRAVFEGMNANEYVENAGIESVDMGTGKARVALETRPDLYFRVISEMTGLTVSDERELMETLRELAAVKEKYDRVAEALNEVEENGYGIVMPAVDELRL